MVEIIHSQNNFPMSSISQILSRKGKNAIHVSPESSVLDALKVMAENNIGSVVIMDTDQFLGIMTERDYSRKVILKGKNSTNTQVKEIMTTDFPELKPSDSVEYCMQLLTENNLRYLPVFQNDNLEGIISISDVVAQTILMQKETIDHLDSYINSAR